MSSEYMFFQIDQTNNVFCFSRLCEVKPFSGPLESLRTPFAEKCNGMGPEVVKLVRCFVLNVLN
jgi:hypothetical protein